MSSSIANTSAEERYTLVKKWGSKGNNPGQFDQPQNLVIDSSTTVFVADLGNHRIQKFDSNGNFITQWGSYCDVNAPDNNCIDPDGFGPLALGDAQFSYPSDAAVDSSHDVYVVDHFNFRIQKFDASGNFITKWGSPGTGDGQFRTPFAIAIDSSDDVYVTDFLNHRIQKFTRAGEFVTKWGSQGTGDGEFRNPRGIAVDSDNNVYVVDGTNQRVQKFDSNGDFKSKWGSFCPVGPGADERCIDPDGPGPSVAGDGQFNEPFGIDVDSSNNVYVADSSNHRIEKFDRNGNFIAKWGSFGSADGEFNNARGIATETSNKIYVADTDNNRIQVLGLIII